MMRHIVYRVGASTYTLQETTSVSHYEVVVVNPKSPTREFYLPKELFFEFARRWLCAALCSLLDPFKPKV